MISFPLVKLHLFFVPIVPVADLLLIFVASVGVPSVDGGATRAPSPKIFSKPFFLSPQVFLGALCSWSPFVAFDVVLLDSCAGVMVISLLLQADLFLLSGSLVAVIFRVCLC
jgi:hypothetical protein